MSKYITVSIGNTDNRLTQQDWYQFTWDMDEKIRQRGQIHFYGGPPNWFKWQNVAWIVEIPEKDVNTMLSEIADMRKKYQQDSAFVMVADGLFV